MFFEALLAQLDRAMVFETGGFGFESHRELLVFKKFLNLFMFFTISQDIPRRYQLFFQDTASPVMSAIMDLHSHINFFLILVFIFVFFQIFDVLNFFRVDTFVLQLDLENDLKK